MTKPTQTIELIDLQDNEIITSEIEIARGPIITEASLSFGRGSTADLDRNDNNSNSNSD